MAPAFGRSHWVVFQAQTADGDAGKTYYTEAPPATRGIPHGFVPGVHSVLDEYCDFVESCRACTGRDLCDTVDSVLALPFGPFSQSLAPDIDSTADPSMRTCFRERGASSVATGRAYMPDNTSEEDALVREPLFRRPCQVSGGDCPFATSYEAVDTFFNAASTLALLAQLAAQRPADAESALRHTHECISRFVDCDDELDAVSAAWAADALVLLSVLYPSNTAVGEDALLDAIAAFPAACQTALGRASTFSAADASVDGADLRAAVVFWNAFRRGGSACAWEAGIAPLLRLVIDKGGSHSVSADDIVAFRSALETAVRAVWLVFSEDGHHPPVGHPASSASSPCNVMRHHIDPVFVGSERDGLVQRGSSVGLKPHSYRQVLAELLGASIEGSNCNVTINEGGLALRVSSDSTILDEKGNERTEKSISPVQTEGACVCVCYDSLGPPADCPPCAHRRRSRVWHQRRQDARRRLAEARVGRKRTQVRAALHRNRPSAASRAAVPRRVWLQPLLLGRERTNAHGRPAGDGQFRVRETRDCCVFRPDHREIRQLTRELTGYVYAVHSTTHHTHTC